MLKVAIFLRGGCHLCAVVDAEPSPGAKTTITKTTIAKTIYRNGKTPQTQKLIPLELKECSEAAAHSLNLNLFLYLGANI